MKLFLTKIKKLLAQVEEAVKEIENNTESGIKKMPELLARMEELLPEWFFFIEQTQMGEKEKVIAVLTDMMQAVEGEDGVLLADALFCGLRELLLPYQYVIEEALDGE